MNDITVKQKVFMENENIKLYNAVGKKIKDYFKQFLNEKIVKTNSELIKKITIDPEFKNINNDNNYKVEPLENGHVMVHIYTYYQYTSLTTHVKLCFSGGTYEDKTHYSIYVERTIYIGDVKNQVLTKINDVEHIKLIDYAEQNKLISEIIEKAKELRLLKDKLNYSLYFFVDWDLKRLV